MKNYFLVKIKYEKTSEEGKIVKVTESYLVDALSFTEAEARIIEEMKPFISGSFDVSSIQKYKLSEMFTSETGSCYFRVKVNMVTLDEEKGIEKKTPCFMIAHASDIKDAREVVEKGLKGTLADYQIESISETKIIDVFNYIN